MTEQIRAPDPALSSATASVLFTLWDFIDIDDADGPSSVAPLSLACESFREYISSHFCRGSVLTVHHGVSNLPRQYFMECSYRDPVSSVEIPHSGFLPVSITRIIAWLYS